MDAPLPSYRELWDDIHHLRRCVHSRFRKLSPRVRQRWDELERRVVDSEWHGHPKDVSPGTPAHGAAFELRLAVQEFLAIHFPDTQKQFVFEAVPTHEEETSF